MIFRKIKNIFLIVEIELITEFANNCNVAHEMPGFKWLRQYPDKAKIEIAPIEVTGNTMIFKRIIRRSFFYLQYSYSDK